MSPITTSDIDPQIVGNDASGDLGDKLTQPAAIDTRAGAPAPSRAGRPILIVYTHPILIVSNESRATTPEPRADRSGDWRALLHAWRRTRDAG